MLVHALGEQRRQTRVRLQRGVEGLHRRQRLEAARLLDERHQPVRRDLRVRRSDELYWLLQDDRLVEEGVRDRVREDLARALHARPVLEVGTVVDALPLRGAKDTTFTESR